MQFLVIGRLIDAPVAPPEQEVALLKATFEHLAGGADPRITAVYPFADERATALVVEVDSADDLGRLLGSLPASRLSTFVAHPIASPHSVLDQLSRWEQMVAGRQATLRLAPDAAVALRAELDAAIQRLEREAGDRPHG